MNLIELPPPRQALISSTRSGSRNCLKPRPQPALSVMVESPMRMIFILWPSSAANATAAIKSAARKKNVAFKQPKVTPQKHEGNFDFVQTGLKLCRRNFNRAGMTSSFDGHFGVIQNHRVFVAGAEVFIRRDVAGHQHSVAELGGCGGGDGQIIVIFFGAAGAIPNVQPVLAHDLR